MQRMALILAAVAGGCLAPTTLPAGVFRSERVIEDHSTRVLPPAPRRSEPRQLEVEPPGARTGCTNYYDQNCYGPNGEPFRAQPGATSTRPSPAYPPCRDYYEPRCYGPNGEPLPR